MSYSTHCLRQHCINSAFLRYPHLRQVGLEKQQNPEKTRLGLLSATAAAAGARPSM